MARKILKTIVEIALIAFAILLISTILSSITFAEDLTEAWVICQPHDYINVRMKPKRQSMAVGYAEDGDSILTDGKRQNGFLRCYGIGEDGIGWIHSGYVVYEEPTLINKLAYSISNARVACRKCIGGKVRKWLKNLDDVMVYWMTDTWCVTSEGFVKTEYLEMEGI